jgi:hypothetical protein
LILPLHTFSSRLQASPDRLIPGFFYQQSSLVAKGLPKRPICCFIQGSTLGGNFPGPENCPTAGSGSVFIPKNLNILKGFAYFV